MTLLYRGMTADELEIAYSPSSMIGGEYLPFIHRYIEESASARRDIPCVCDVEYGVSKGQVFDLFHGESVTRGKAAAELQSEQEMTRDKNALHLFIHGGYWQELSHKESATLARPLTQQGVSVAVVNYTLAPTASIDEMVDECYQCLMHLVSNHIEFQIDPSNISVSGHSAGAQLMMMMVNKYRNEPVMVGVKLLIPISGIYDLTPLCFTSINDALALNEARATKLSPLHNVSAISQHVHIVVAENDTPEFIRQATDYHEKLHQVGVSSELTLCPNLNHFDIILGLENPTVPIVRSTNIQQ